jgi:hypothetical protein
VKKRRKERLRIRDAAVAAVKEVSRGQGIFLSVLAACFLVVSVVVFRDVSARQRGNQDVQFLFQQAIGGVGLGSVTVPSWNFSYYDPRLQVLSEDVLYPIPGGYSYSPDRLAMVTSFAAE